MSRGDEATPIDPTETASEEGSSCGHPLHTAHLTSTGPSTSNVDTDLTAELLDQLLLDEGEADAEEQDDGTAECWAAAAQETEEVGCMHNKDW